MRQSIVAERSARRPREFWVQLVHQWEASGASQQSIADGAEVNIHTLRYWIEKSRKAALPADKRRERSDFVEVSRVCAENKPATVACRIHVGKRVVLELPALPPVEWLLALGNEA